MRTTILGWTLAILGLVAFPIVPPTHAADPLAITNGASGGGGFIFGAAVFSFTPATNLTVTSVGYWNNSLSNPIIRFWTDTNLPIATYLLAPSPSNGVMIYSNVSLPLLAGHRYSISLQDGTSAPPAALLAEFVEWPAFRPATVLSNYRSAVILGGGQFTSFSTNYFLLGPNFTFQTGAVMPEAPPLNITAAGPDAARLAWPATSGFVLQQQTNLAETNWTLVSQWPQIAEGSNQVLITPLPASGYYRLIYP